MIDSSLNSVLVRVVHVILTHTKMQYSALFSACFINLIVDKGVVLELIEFSTEKDMEFFLWVDSGIFVLTKCIQSPFSKPKPSSLSLGDTSLRFVRGRN